MTKYKKNITNEKETMNENWFYVNQINQFLNSIKRRSLKSIYM